jgi:hypothetical protein
MYRTDRFLEKEFDQPSSLTFRWDGSNLMITDDTGVLSELETAFYEATCPGSAPDRVQLNANGLALGKHFCEDFNELAEYMFQLTQTKEFEGFVEEVF